MPRDQEALIDIFQAAQRVVLFTQGVTRPELESNEEKQAAIHSSNESGTRTRSRAIRFGSRFMRGN